ncbi:uncharacterized protein LOC118430163 [Branchiostoma floridae]|uniref:Uncharacterized protein LOC118430163 n=1 Tax=Branchiostoma floridae TaxID=7739 RepID=A0A9J7M9I0_BRAFL|nr:uncharacterized protein LOC118430163 [Branchiostoma floridae]
MTNLHIYRLMSFDACFFSGRLVCSCFLPCIHEDSNRLRGHYHCPICTGIVRRKDRFEKHLKNHTKESTSSQSCVEPESSQSRVESASSQSRVESASSQSRVASASSQPHVEPEYSQSRVESASSQSRVEPESSQSRVESASSQPHVEPESSQSRVESASSQSRVEPESSQSRVESASSQPHVEPESSQSRVESASSQSRVESESSQSRVESASSQSRVESASSQPHVEPESSQSRVESASSQSRVESASSQSHVEPESSQSRVESASSQSRVESASSQSRVESASSQPHVEPESAQSRVVSASSQSRVESESSQSCVESASFQSHVESASTRVQKSGGLVKCKLCHVEMLKKSIRRHMTNKHNDHFTDISEKRHHQCISVDPKLGLYMVSKSISGPTYPLHVRLHLSGPNQQVKCEQEGCNDILNAVSRGGDVSFQCTHLLSVPYAEAAPSEVELNEEHLPMTGMTQERQAECVDLQSKAALAGAPLVVPWQPPGAHDTVFLSVYDGGHHHWAKLGRAVVALSGNILNCTCCKIKRGCIHKGISKWWSIQHRGSSAPESDHLVDTCNDTDTTEYTASMIRTMTSYLRTKTIPKNIKYLDTVGHELLNPTIHPKEEVCTLCENTPKLQEELATSKAKIVGLQHISTGKNMFCKILHYHMAALLCKLQCTSMEMRMTFIY